MEINGDFMKFWAQSNHQQDFAKDLAATSLPMQYALEQIQKADEKYPSEIDFDTPLCAESLSAEDVQTIAPKKRESEENNAINS